MPMLTSHGLCTFCILVFEYQFKREDAWCDEGHQNTCGGGGWGWGWGERSQRWEIQQDRWKTDEPTHSTHIFTQTTSGTGSWCLCDWSSIVGGFEGVCLAPFQSVLDKIDLTKWHLSNPQDMPSGLYWGCKWVNNECNLHHPMKNHESQQQKLSIASIIDTLIK